MLKREQATGAEHLQSSQKKNTGHAEFLAPAQLQPRYHAKGQYQDGQIDDALENPCDKPERCCS